MSDNTSKVQHITALDFDISPALTQLAELQNRVNTLTQQLAGTNWKIDAVINGSDAYTTLSNKLKDAQEESKKLREEIQSMSENSINHTSLLASAIESKLVNALKNASAAAYEATKDTEDSMVEISRVLNLTASETEKLRSSLFSLGKEYGRSFADTADIALRYAQAGNDMNDTLSQTNDFLLALNTAELDVENGVQSLIGIMSQWGMSASDLSTVIDKLNYTADNNAVTTQDLVDGLLKRRLGTGGSSLHQRQRGRRYILLRRKRKELLRESRPFFQILSNRLLYVLTAAREIDVHILDRNVQKIKHGVHFVKLPVGASDKPVGNI